MSYKSDCFLELFPAYTGTQVVDQAELGPRPGSYISYLRGVTDIIYYKEAITIINYRK